MCVTAAENRKLRLARRVEKQVINDRMMEGKLFMDVFVFQSHLILRDTKQRYKQKTKMNQIYLKLNVRILFRTLKYIQ